MKHIRMLSAVLLVCLLFSVFSAGCTREPAVPSAPVAASDAARGTTAAPTSTEPPQTAPATLAPETTETAEPVTTEPEPTEPEEPLPVRWRNGGLLSFLPKEALTIPKLSEMECEQIDPEPLIAKLEALTEKAADCDDADELLADYNDLLPALVHYYTMSGLSYVRFTQNSALDENRQNYQYYEDHNLLVEQAEDALYTLLARKDCREALEQASFGEGFFADYENGDVLDGPYYELTKRENELIDQYYELANGGISMYDDNSVQRNHDDLAEVFVELVKLRAQIAAEAGFENYTEYCYTKLFHRDYTPEQAREFLNQVKVCLVPLGDSPVIWNALDASYTASFSPERALSSLEAAAKEMGGPIWEAFRFLSGYELYDITYRANKRECAYTTYIYDYEAPAIIIYPSGSSYTSFAHEFGHFTDMYYNYCDSESPDISEIYSQVMEYLYLAYEDAPEMDRKLNTRVLLADMLTYSIFRECAYADFEMQAYALAPEEVTAEKLDSIFFQCMAAYGLIDKNDGSIEGKRWVGYHHFIDHPGYLISYATSAVAALEICEMEASERGAGVAAFNRLLNRTHGKQFAYVLEEAGLGSPFEAESLERIAAFMKATFRLS